VGKFGAVGVSRVWYSTLVGMEAATADLPTARIAPLMHYTFACHQRAMRTR